MAIPASRHLSTAELAQELGLDCSSSHLASIDEDALARLAEHIREHPDFSHYTRYTWDDPKFWLPEGSPSERSQYLTIGNAVNFRFWSLANGDVVPAGGLVAGDRLTGAMYMWRCLRRSLDQGTLPLLDAAFLANLDGEQLDLLFADDSGINPLAIAREDRIANLRDLGARLLRDWEGQFSNVIEAAATSLTEFVRLSATFRAFDDPLFKLTMVNAILHLGSGIATFDADPLPGIDYHLLKQLLRQGVVVPRPPLEDKLILCKLLTADESYELRRVALCAFVEISRQTCLSGEILDNKWWWNRRRCLTAEPVCLHSATAHECPFLDACAQLTTFGIPVEETRRY